MNKYKILTWDTNFFHYKIGEVLSYSLSQDELKDIIADAKLNNFSLLYAFIDPSNKEMNRIATVSGGKLVDEKVTYKKKLSVKITNFSNPSIVSFKNKVATKKIHELTLQSGIYSRFNIDKHFKNKEYERLYLKWIELSLLGEIAHDVLVYMNDGIEIGFVTVGEKNGRGNIGLLSVDRIFRGKGVGRSLVSAAEKEAYSAGFIFMQVVTQKRNIPACHLYEKSGFEKESIENVYHFWLT